MPTTIHIASRYTSGIRGDYLKLLQHANRSSERRRAQG